MKKTPHRSELLMPAGSALELAKEAFKLIEHNFPDLAIEDDIQDAVELSFTFPIQEKLKYEVNLNLQNNDELHFSVSNFWCEWFPCTKSDCREDYIDAVIGFLSGKYRIVEYYKGTKCTKAKLQKPVDKTWKTIATSSHLHFYIPWHIKQQKIIQN